MKINAKSLEFANCSAYKLRTNPKVKKSDVYNLVVKYYAVGTPEEWLQFMEAIAQGDALQVFKNKEQSQEVKDGPVLTGLEVLLLIFFFLCGKVVLDGVVLVVLCIRVCDSDINDAVCLVLPQTLDGYISSKFFLLSDRNLVNYYRQVLIAW
eukprot:15365279-Ditylum_brightwellii.AAC.1